MEYDDIIVGGGSAGAVLAARLSEEPARRVLLLEAGPDYATLEVTPSDLQDAWRMSFHEHDWGLSAQAIPAGRFRIRADGWSAALLRSTLRLPCAVCRLITRVGDAGQRRLELDEGVAALSSSGR